MEKFKLEKAFHFHSYLDLISLFDKCVIHLIKPMHNLLNRLMVSHQCQIGGEKSMSNRK